MKLNATSEMIPDHLARLCRHSPLRAAPTRPTGYLPDDRRALPPGSATITGFDAISMQPNSGAQGEYAGLVAIQQIPREPRRSSSQRLPDPQASAHGTNPAIGTDVQHGVVVVNCDEQRQRGLLPTCKAKAEQHAGEQARLR
jgi:glycine dehydrogenase